MLCIHISCLDTKLRKFWKFLNFCGFFPSTNLREWYNSQLLQCDCAPHTCIAPHSYEFSICTICLLCAFSSFSLSCESNTRRELAAIGSWRDGNMKVLFPNNSFCASNFSCFLVESYPILFFVDHVTWFAISWIWIFLKFYSYVHL